MSWGIIRMIASHYLVETSPNIHDGDDGPTIFRTILLRRKTKYTAKVETKAAIGVT
jgi:hypothetical protein